MTLRQNSDGAHTLLTPLLFGLLLGGLAFTLTMSPVSFALHHWASDNQPSTAFSEADEEVTEDQEQSTPVPRLLINGQSIPLTGGEVKQEFNSNSGKTSVRVYSQRTSNGNTSNHSTTHISISSSDHAGANSEIRYEE